MAGLDTQCQKLRSALKFGGAGWGRLIARCFASTFSRTLIVAEHLFEFQRGLEGLVLRSNP